MIYKNNNGIFEFREFVISSCNSCSYRICVIVKAASVLKSNCTPLLQFCAFENIVKFHTLFNQKSPIVLWSCNSEYIIMWTSLLLTQKILMRTISFINSYFFPNVLDVVPCKMRISWGFKNKESIHVNMQKKNKFGRCFFYFDVFLVIYYIWIYIAKVTIFFPEPWVINMIDIHVIYNFFNFSKLKFCACFLVHFKCSV